ncbi:MAG: LacI family DNA-binding transcriptional regulator [Candidatus Neomarinimicrobiota bacterium]
MRATLKQVAKDTDLSIATVSRALRRKKRRYSVNEEKIYAAARKLGYPFIGSDNIQDTSSIALVAEIHEGEFYSSLFYGFNAASKNSNSDVIFVNAATDLEDPVNFITDLSKKYSGICLFLPSLGKKNYSKIKDSVGSYPIVSVVSGKNLKIDSISFDSYSGGYMVAKHFQELGYSKLGMIEGPSGVVDATFRKNGFMDHINDHQNLDLVWSYKGDFSNKSGTAAFKSFMKEDLNNVAIFGANDHMSFGFIKEAYENNYKIPMNYIIAGYDDLSFCESITPELTSVSTNFESLAKRAIKTIENMINDKSDIVGQVSMIPVEIKIRKSTKA